MNLISTTYLAFFLIVFTLYWLVPNLAFRKGLLLIASFVFYGWVQPWMAAMLAISIILNHWISAQLGPESDHRKSFYYLGLLLNIGSLGFFKYFHFIEENIIAFFKFSGDSLAATEWTIWLPLGISFFTFQSISYLTDVYHGALERRKSLLDFSLYIALFMQLVAGPIERGKNLLPQIEALRTWDWERFNQGWMLVILGYLNKVVIADNVAMLVDKVFILQKPTIFLLGIGSLAFALQIYADFSAYTNLARGFGKLLGFDLAENFNSPYLSLSPADFWNRWHISLSTWLRDYIFFPVRRWALQKKTNNLLTLFLPPLLTMLISGFWHGVGWNFILWGVYYGLLLFIYQLLELDARLRTASPFQKLFAWGVNFGLTVFGWTLFRASSVGWLLNAFRSPVWGRYEESLITGAVILLLTAFYALPMLLKRVVDRVSPRFPLAESLYYALAVCFILIFIGSGSQDFIYFNF